MRALLVSAALALTSSCGDWGWGCDNSTIQDVPSPDGRRHAVVFARSCGATTAFSTQVSILTQGRSARGAGNVFIVDGDHGKAPAGPGGGPIVVARWKDARTVEIRYHASARAFLQDLRHDDTNIQYVPDASLTARP